MLIVAAVIGIAFLLVLVAVGGMLVFALVAGVRRQQSPVDPGSSHVDPGSVPDQRF